jgi:O-antigen/teichoic acid export membrane protein
MSAYFKSSKDDLIRTYTLAFRYLLIIVLPLAVGTVFVADKVILLIYGTPFTDSSTVLRILMWSVMFGMVNTLLWNVLVAIDMQKLIMLSVTFCAAVNIVLNLILIPVMSYNGAAIATVATVAILALSLFYFVSKHLQTILVHKVAVKPVIAALVMGVFVYYFMNFNVLIVLLLAAVVYMVMLLALKTFSKEEVEMIKGIISSKKTSAD